MEKTPEAATREQQKVNDETLHLLKALVFAFRVFSRDNRQRTKLDELCVASQVFDSLCLPTDLVPMHEKQYFYTFEQE